MNCPAAIGSEARLYNAKDRTPVIIAPWPAAVGRAERNEEQPVKHRTYFRCGPIVALAFLAAGLAPPASMAGEGGDGVIHVASAYSLDETVARIKADIAKKGIVFFADIDQGKLVNEAGISVQPTRLLIFGNPPLGGQFLTSNPDAGLDWPVRLLVREDAEGRVWAVYNDFAWIADRFDITDRKSQFAMASEVIGSITSSVADH